ncbi:MAG: hypothetical protein Aurels2KO_11300 [Aureliella sp.]
MQKRRYTQISFATIAIALSSLNMELTQAAAQVRVACLGDSITAGARVDVETESYPARLQSLLGDEFHVRNFGIGGATLIKTGRPNVWSSLDVVEDFAPNVIVISLGTNDTVAGKRKNWEKIQRFNSDYRDLIDQLSSLPSSPQIILCTPTAMVLSTPGLSESRLANLQERQPRLQELCKRVRQLAAENATKQLTLLELNRTLRDRPDLVTAKDGVHPNAAGYDAIAHQIASTIRSQRSTKPNIVLFLVDDMGWQDTSVPFHNQITELNRRYHTPNMQKLAEHGTKFTSAYACSVCSPTRISLMTGLNAARHRVTNWTLEKNASNDRKHPRLDFPNWNVNGMSPQAGVERTVHARALPDFLKSAGYHTIHVGKAHFGAIGTPASDPRNIGFDVNIAGHAAGGPGSFLATQNFSAQWRGGGTVWDVPGLDAYHGKDTFLTEALTIEANKAMDAAVALDKPFFLYMSHYAVHVPFAEDSRFYQKYRDGGLDHTEAMYAAMVEGMDKSLGDILANVERHGLSGETVVLFMSDNGGFSAGGRGGEPHTHNRPLSSGKGSAHEGGVRVPMLASWPGVIETGAVCDSPVMIEDFFPTILEIAGVASPQQVGGEMDGVSFGGLLRGQDDLQRATRPLFWHFPNNWGPTGPGIGASSSIRLGEWKLIYYHDSRDYELFNLANDISESQNLASDHPDIRRKLAGRLSNHLRSASAQMPVVKELGQSVPFPQ